jgi:hypothetical protein
MARVVENREIKTAGPAEIEVVSCSTRFAVEKEMGGVSADGNDKNAS